MPIEFDADAHAPLLEARKEAVARGATEISPEHLMLALLSASPECLLDAFRMLNVNTADLKQAIEAASPRKRTPGKQKEVPLSQLASSILKNVEIETESLNQTVAGPEHILLGFARVPNTSVSRELARQGVVLDQVREVVRSIGGRRQREVALADTPDLDVDAPAHRRQVARVRDHDFAIVWDPAIVSADDYAKLVAALGDLARASGGEGVQRVGWTGVGIAVEIGVIS